METSSISLWILAGSAVFSSLGAGQSMELSSRFPEEGGLYVWAKEAFSEIFTLRGGMELLDLHGVLFPGLLLASAAMSAYIMEKMAEHFPQNRMFCFVSVGMLWWPSD